MKKDYRDRDPLTEKIIKACYKIHNELGPGFTEKIYVSALKMVFKDFKLSFDSEKEFLISFQNERIGKFRVDFVVENIVIVEVKAIESKMPKIFEAQVISYLKASKLKVGLLVNFGNYRCEVRRLMI